MTEERRKRKRNPTAGERRMTKKLKRFGGGRRVCEVRRMEEEKPLRATVKEERMEDPLRRVSGEFRMQGGQDPLMMAMSDPLML